MPKHFRTGSGFARALKRVLDDDQFNAAEIAEVAGRSERHIYNVVRGDEPAELHIEDAERVSRYLCKHGELRPARAFLCTQFEIVRRGEGRANGRVDDDVTAMTMGSGSFARAHATRDFDGMDAAISEMEQALLDAKAERDRVAAGQNSSILQAA